MKRVTVIASATPVPPTSEPVGEPSIDGANTRGKSEFTIQLGSGAGPIDVTGDNLETATQIILRDPDHELLCTVPATYADGKLTGTPNYSDAAPAIGFVYIETTGGHAEHEVSYES